MEPGALLRQTSTRRSLLRRIQTGLLPRYFTRSHPFSGAPVAALLAALLTVSAWAAERPKSDDLAHMREELGVNSFTAPSIEKLFQQLTALQPLNFEKLWRQPPGDIPQDRPRMALLAGTAIADGFLAVSVEKQSKIEPSARALLRLARGLGIGDRITKHGQTVLELAAREQWPDVRRELVRSQAEVEAALLSLKDEEIAHLIALGGWMRGLEITSTAVADRYTPERSRVLIQPELLAYFTDRLSTLNPTLKATPLFQKLTEETADMRKLVSKDASGTLSPEEVDRVREIARSMVKQISAHD